MGKILLLPANVANQVAAGEIVERPSSIVKELVENSVDAGAKRITVEFLRGGAELIRISDDGCGMDREDALLSLQRHATSKIRQASDLALVATMGFRGEALPSIASVSRFRMATRMAGQGGGTEILISGGIIDEIHDCGGASGTIIEAKSLFYNLPARKKFMRGEHTEAAHIVHQMEGLAIAHPHVTMILIRDNKKIWQAAGTKILGSRLSDIFGSEFPRRLHEISDFAEEGIAISGYLSKPGECRSDREQQFIVVNGRVVDCPPVFQSLREAYVGSIPRGKNPLAVLRIDLDPHSFDCNVHPAKREIRIHKPELIRQAIFSVVTETLHSIAKPKPSIGVAVGMLKTVDTVAAPIKPDLAQPVLHAVSPQIKLPPLELLSKPTPPYVPRSFTTQTNTPIIADTQASPYSVVGPISTKWIVLEGNSGLVLLDTKKASERIVFERLSAECNVGNIPTQLLLIPIVIDLPAKDSSWLSEHLSIIKTAGFEIEPFGGMSFNISAVPHGLPIEHLQDSILDICTALRATGAMASPSHITNSLVSSVSSLVAANQFTYSKESAENLIHELLTCKLPYTCPRGRPTMIQWSFAELTRKFG